ncbi:hypothetical protein ILYODFUR_029205 [Ilyodon furcidens]|uniref:Uncharacterized protein n=1 Tax=Ilyodon furcidens TaxID=33524 RepID=A0ABV0V914_9TELE
MYAYKVTFGLICLKHAVSPLLCHQRDLYQTAKRNSFGFLSTMSFFLPLYHKDQICASVFPDDGLNNTPKLWNIVLKPNPTKNVSSTLTLTCLVCSLVFMMLFVS